MTVQEPPELPPRLERELQEIFEKADREPTPIDIARARAMRIQATAPSRLQHFRERMAPKAAPMFGWIGAFLFALLALLLGRWSDFVAQILTILSFACLVAPIALSFRGGPSSPTGSGFGSHGTPPATDWSKRLRR